MLVLPLQMPAYLKRWGPTDGTEFAYPPVFYILWFLVTRPRFSWGEFPLLEGFEQVGFCCYRVQIIIRI